MIKKINEGMTGAEAAEVIQFNDLEAASNLKLTSYIEDRGVNIFNPALIVAENSYANYTDGTIQYSADYNLYYLKPTKGATYQSTALSHVAYYDEDKNYVSGQNSFPSGFFTFPNNASYALVTVNRDTIQSTVIRRSGTENGVAIPSLILENTDALLNKATGNNLLNPINIVATNAYVNYQTGGFEGLAGCNVFEFEVEPGGKYVTPNVQQMAFYDDNKVYISGVPHGWPTEGLYVFTAPTGAKFACFNVIGDYADAVMNRGIEIFTGGNEFKKTLENLFIPSVNVVGGAFANTGKVFVIDKVGGDFASINGALSFIKDDSVNNPYTLLVMPGTYVESVNLAGRAISLIGLDKKTTIIKTYTNDYYYPPLDLNGPQSVINFTVIADDDGVTTPPNGVNNMPAYALHFDGAGRFEPLGDKIKGMTYIKNVDFISKHQHAAGIGISPDQHLYFENCTFKAYTTTAFRAHNYPLASTAPQLMTCENCEMYNVGSSIPIALQDANHRGGPGDNYASIFTFKRCIAYNDVNNEINLVDGNFFPIQGPEYVAGFIKRGRNSFGNNASELNA